MSEFDWGRSVVFPIYTDILFVLYPKFFEIFPIS